MLLSLTPDTPLCPHRWDVDMCQGSTWSRTLGFGDPIAAGVQFRGSIARRPGAPILARFRAEVLDDHQITLSLTAVETAVLPAGALTRCKRGGVRFKRDPCPRFRVSNATWPASESGQVGPHRHQSAVSGFWPSRN